MMGRLLDGPMEETNADIHVHEGGLFIVTIAQDIKRNEKIKQFISVCGGVHHDGPKGLCYPRDC